MLIGFLSFKIKYLLAEDHSTKTLYNHLFPLIKYEVTFNPHLLSKEV